VSRIDNGPVLAFPGLHTGACGNAIATVKEQLTRLAAADFRVLMGTGDEVHVLKGAFVDQFKLWAGGRDGERTPTVVRLSPAYFESLLSRAAPLNESAVWCLAHNAMAMNICKRPGKSSSDGAAIA